MTETTTDIAKAQLIDAIIAGCPEDTTLTEHTASFIASHLIEVYPQFGEETMTPTRSDIYRAWNKEPKPVGDDEPAYVDDLIAAGLAREDDVPAPSEQAMDDDPNHRLLQFDSPAEATAAQLTYISAVLDYVHDDHAAELKQAMRDLSWLVARERKENAEQARPDDREALIALFQHTGNWHVSDALTEVLINRLIADGWTRRDDVLPEHPGPPITIHTDEPNFTVDTGDDAPLWVKALRARRPVTGAERGDKTVRHAKAASALLGNMLENRGDESISEELSEMAYYARTWGFISDDLDETWGDVQETLERIDARAPGTTWDHLVAQDKWMTVSEFLALQDAQPNTWTDELPLILVPDPPAAASGEDGE